MEICGCWEECGNNHLQINLKLRVKIKMLWADKCYEAVLFFYLFIFYFFCMKGEYSVTGFHQPSFYFEVCVTVEESRRPFRPNRALLKAIFSFICGPRCWRKKKDKQQRPKTFFRGLARLPTEQLGKTKSQTELNEFQEFSSYKLIENHVLTSIFKVSNNFVSFSLSFPNNQ